MISFAVHTQSVFDLVNLTSQINQAIAKSGVKNGVVLVFIPQTTAGIICNEDETNLKTDILKIVSFLKNHSGFFGGFAHNSEDGNAHAHIVASIAGSSRSFIIAGGKLQLGTWQSVMLLEMDGPREREVWVKIISNK